MIGGAKWQNFLNTLVYHWSLVIGHWSLVSASNALRFSAMTNNK
jgi:hypothetical protein